MNTKIYMVVKGEVFWFDQRRTWSDMYSRIFYTKDLADYIATEQKGTVIELDINVT